PPQSVIIDQTLTFVVKATDKDKDPVTYGLKNAPSWLQIDPKSGAITGTPSTNDKGNITITITASDGDKEVSSSVEIQVIDNPIFFPPPTDVLMAPGTITNVGLIAISKDGRPVSIELKNAPSWVHLENTTLKLSPGNDVNGKFSITLVAKNGQVEKDMTIAIEVDNRIQFHQIPSYNLKPGADISTPLSYETKDKNEKVKLSLRNNPKWIQLDSIRTSATVGQHTTFLPTLLIKAPLNSTGKYTFDVVATGSSRFEAVMKVDVVITDPTFSFIQSGDISVISSDIKTFDLQAKSFDNETLSFFVKKGPSWVSIDDRGIISIDPKGALAGKQKIEIGVSDKKNKLTAYGIYNVDIKNLTSTPETYQNKYSTYFSALMTLPKVSNIDAYVQDSVEINKPKILTMDDVKFDHINGYWYLTNNTFRPLKNISVNINNDSKPILLNFDEEVLPFTKVKFEMSEQNVNKITFVQQMVIYNPNFKFLSQDRGKIYKVPAKEDVKYFGHLISLYHDRLNRKGVVDYFQTFDRDFDECQRWEECVRYSKSYPNELSYALRTYLVLGSDGHHMELATLYNDPGVYGRGTGKMPNIRDTIDNTSGFLAIISGYAALSLFVHEGGHAYGYLHDSPVTYDISSWIGSNSDPVADRDGIKYVYDDIVELHAPDILVKPEYAVDKYELKLELFSKFDLDSAENISFRIFGPDKHTFTTQFDTDGRANTIVFKFNSTITSPVFIQLWDNDSIYLTTVKIDPADLVSSQ
ncbi:putative Ig domain-containing protein, partial [Photobacterium damselae]